MRELGGYIELDRYTFPMLHEGAVALNCGRNCLAYLIRAKGVRKIALPYFLCGSVVEVCRRENVAFRFYHIGTDFRPKAFTLEEDEWLYLVNYYGQLDRMYIEEVAAQHFRLIVDNAQAYFQMPVAGIDTLYTCRKYFGVSDGAFLYTDARLAEPLLQDESFDRMRFLLGRFERTASEFYGEYVQNNNFLAGEPIKRMSKLTNNLLHGIDYERVRTRRTKNFVMLHQMLECVNLLRLNVPEGAFMYPLYVENGDELRKLLQKEQLYIPLLWLDVFDVCEESYLEYDMAKNILPLPCDQRYDKTDMQIICNLIQDKLS